MKIDPTGFPMMAEHEVNIINDIIQKEKPEICLEWGSGNSTICFPNANASIKSWLSIEHLGNYVKYVSEKADPNKVSVLWVPDNEWYVDCVKHQGRKYDFVLVDGISDKRAICLEIAMQVAKEGSIVLLHDSGREEYQKFISKYGGKAEKLCEGEKPVKNGYFAHRGLTRFYV